MSVHSYIYIYKLGVLRISAGIELQSAVVYEDNIST